MLVVLGKAGIKTLDDLADLATDELIDANDGILREHEMSREDADALIMKARAHWFADEPAAAAKADDKAAAPAE